MKTGQLMRTSLILPACLCSILSAQQPAPRLTLAPCTVPGAGLEARCGTLMVPEHRSDPAGRMIGLRVMLVPATGKAPKPDPIAPLPGGPGAGVIGAAGGWSRILADARAERALLFVDPRGTGLSGALDCDLDDPQGHLGGYFRDFLPPGKVRRCREDLEKRVDLTAYST